MIYSLNGILSHIDTNFIVIDCSGVGYLVFIPQRIFYSLPTIGSNIFIYIYTNIRENAVELFGFDSKQDLSCFKLLISVSGVGPKAAIAILSQLASTQVLTSISLGDSKTLVRAQGVGKKLADRIILELRDKLSSKGAATGAINSVTPVPLASNNISQATDALLALGFSSAEAAISLANLESSLSTEELIRKALERGIK